MLCHVSGKLSLVSGEGYLLLPSSDRQGQSLWWGVSKTGLVAWGGGHCTLHLDSRWTSQALAALQAFHGGLYVTSQQRARTNPSFLKLLLVFLKSIFIQAIRKGTNPLSVSCLPPRLAGLNTQVLFPQVLLVCGQMLNGLHLDPWSWYKLILLCVTSHCPKGPLRQGVDLRAAVVGGASVKWER